MRPRKTAGSLVFKLLYDMDVRVIQEETVYENRTSALIKLNITVMEPGVSYVFRYKVGGKIDSLFALGTAHGKGPGCYSLVSDQSIPSIADIVFEYPDVSEVLYGEVYLLIRGGSRNEDYEENGLIIDVEISESTQFVLVQINEDLSKTETILDYPMYFSCTKDKKMYFADPDRKFVIDVSYNLYQASAIKSRIEELEKSIVKVEVRGNTLVIL